MPTILTHALLPLIAGKAMGKDRISTRLTVAGMVAAMLPDADVIGFRFGIPYGAELGHRGASHSLLFAALMGMAAMLAARTLPTTPARAAVFVSLSAASHGLTDMLTDGGRGVGLWWPFSDDRLFWPVRPVEVSSIGLGALTDGSLAGVLLSELIWLLLPALLLALLYRRTFHPHIDLAQGQS